MAFEPGHPKYGGRTKGTLNRTTREIKSMLREALELEGGVDYLRRIARTKPDVFCQLVSKLIPSEVKARMEVDMTPLLEVVDIGARPEIDPSRDLTPEEAQQYWRWVETDARRKLAALQGRPVVLVQTGIDVGAPGSRVPKTFAASPSAEHKALPAPAQRKLLPEPAPVDAVAVEHAQRPGTSIKRPPPQLPGRAINDG